MNLLSENVIPGNHGKTFGTDAMKEAELLDIKASILQIEGINDVLLNNSIFPREFTVHTTKMVPVKEIENKVKSVGFHAIPKDAFPL